MHFNRFGTTGLQSSPLTIDALRVMVPSAFATQPHKSRSERYTYIPTSDVIEAMMREGFQPFKAMQGGSRVEGKKEFTKHLIRFRHPDMQGIAVNGNLPEVVLINSHDGTSAYKLMAGIFRMVCSNGLIIAESTIGSLSVPHKGDVVNRVIEGSFEIVGNSRKALDTITGWQNLQLTNGEQTAFAEAAHTIRFADAEGKIDTPITASMLLGVRRAADDASDLYTTMNIVQENVLRGGLTARAPRKPGEYRGRRVTTRTVNGIDQDVRLNRALWQLAERMAELKGMRLAA